MLKGLQSRQEQMKQRQLERVNAPRVMVTVEERVGNPVDYSQPVEYVSDVILLQHWPQRSGVYLLAEGRQFYIGQSIDVPARFASHRLKPVNCQFEDPRCALLAEVPFRGGWSYTKNTHVRLNAEARFIAAAISLELPLTNTLSEYTRAKLLSKFADVSSERERIEKAVKFLC
jgi:hypothetical protein